ncbi:hypothetical protein INR49_000315 [Caranx melampygus]|nr:hypothetical protein INR49_000315 [Caranx melampygus]
MTTDQNQRAKERESGSGLPGAALPCGGDGHHNTALVPHMALPLGQIGQSHSSVDLPPALLVSSLLASVLLLVPDDAGETTSRSHSLELKDSE